MEDKRPVWCGCIARFARVDSRNDERLFGIKDKTGVPSSDEIALWRAQLTEAEAALHSIVVNGSVARMRHGDKSMEWNAQNVGTLRAYIAELRGKLGLPGRGSARRVSF